MVIRNLATDGQAAKKTVIAEMVAAGTEPKFKIIKDGQSQTEAMALERGIILKIGTDKLTNMPRQALIGRPVRPSLSSSPRCFAGRFLSAPGISRLSAVPFGSPFGYSNLIPASSKTA
jgi:hypothetical protein